jgi:hypothetical protein
MVPEEERLWRDLLRAVHAQGDQAELHTVVDELRFHVQRGPMMDQMQPETEALIEELVPFYRPGRTVTPHLARGA